MNINNKVSFELTESGLKILNDYNAKVISQGYHKDNFSVAKCTDGVYTMQLWEVLAVFGKGCALGVEAPFKDCEIDMNVGLRL